MPWYVVAWLWVIIAFDGLGAIAFLFTNEIVIKGTPHVPGPLAALYVLDDILSIIFAIAVLRWKKWGAWGILLLAASLMVGAYAYAGFVPTLWGIGHIVVLCILLNVGGRNRVWPRLS